MTEIKYLVCGHAVLLSQDNRGNAQAGNEYWYSRKKAQKAQKLIFAISNINKLQNQNSTILTFYENVNIENWIMTICGPPPADRSYIASHQNGLNIVAQILRKHDLILIDWSWSCSVAPLNLSIRWENNINGQHTSILVTLVIFSRNHDPKKGFIHLNCWSNLP